MRILQQTCLIFFLALLASNCSNQADLSHSSRGMGQSSEDQKGSDPKTEISPQKQSPKDPGAIPDANQTHESEESVVSAPVMTGGAFLVCREEVAAEEPRSYVVCGLRDDEGNALIVKEETPGTFELLDQKTSVEIFEINAGVDELWPFQNPRPQDIAEGLYEVRAWIPSLSDRPFLAELSLDAYPAAPASNSPPPPSGGTATPGTTTPAFNVNIERTVQTQFAMGDEVAQTANPPFCVQLLQQTNKGPQSSFSSPAIPMKQGYKLTINLKGLCGIETNSYVEVWDVARNMSIKRFTLKNGDSAYQVTSIPQTGDYRIILHAVIVPGYSDVDDFYVGEFSYQLQGLSGN